MTKAKKNKEVRDLSIDFDKEYCCIAHTQKKGEFKLWRDIIFEKESVLHFYLEQEILCYERKNVQGDLPSEYSLSRVPEWKIKETPNLRVFRMPNEVETVIESFVMSYQGICIPMVLNDDEMTQMYYSGRFGILPNDESSTFVPGHSQNKVTDTENYAMFGLRMRPLIQSPKKKNSFSMSGSGLPGLWYISIGERKENDLMPTYL